MLKGFFNRSRDALAVLAAKFPSSCALCADHCTGGLCDGCHAQFFRHQPLRCPRCGVPMTSSQQEQTCGDCLRHPPCFDATIVASDYLAPIDQMVLALKFGGQLALAPLFARLLQSSLTAVPADMRPAVLVPVPLGSQRLAQRGFNQAMEIARPLSRALQVRLDHRLIVRARETAAQAELHPDQRHKNIRRAFVVPAGAQPRIQGCHLGVVDDVMTTGATLNELAATLKRFGAARVTNIVFARTPPK